MLSTSKLFWTMEVVSSKNPVHWVTNLFVLGWIFMGCISLGVVGFDGAPYVPEMFVFGDSLADMGTNNFIPDCKMRANFTPYGISSFPIPTGRFSDGLNTFDHIAILLGLPSPSPVLSSWTSLSSGINFASAGSGLLDSTGKAMNVMPVSQQIQQFRNISNTFNQEQGAEKAMSLIAMSLFCISIASNDIGEYFNLTAPPDMEEYAKHLVTKFDQHFGELYKAGARKFLVIDAPAPGCTPLARSITDSIFPHQCNPWPNILSEKYNNGLTKLVDRLNKKLDGASIILLNAYSFVLDMVYHGESYGFLETKKACCGSGTLNADVHCGLTTPPDVYCQDPDKYLFWDFAHPTQMAAKFFADAIWSENSSVIHPFNLSTLVMARK